MEYTKKLTAALWVFLAGAVSAPVSTAETYSLDSCRAMALSNNKELMVKAERVRQAGYQRKQAFAAYLPALDFAGGYTYNQKKLSLFDSDQLLPTKSFNLATQSYEFNVVTNPITHQPVTTPDGTPIPSEVALIPKEAMEFDIHNVFFGAVTLTQPIYMGGKIVAMNRLAKIQEEANRMLQENESQNVIYAVDAAYWTVVSLNAKHRLAKSYVNLLDTLDRNVKLMLDQGVATRSDLLSVDVKLNEANVDLLKVENGLSLSRMALAQICGLPVHSDINVADEGVAQAIPSAEIATRYNMEEVYSRRPDLRALEMASEATVQQKRVALSEMLPNIALIGSYSFTNPNMFDGFKNRFGGAFSVGVMVKIPPLALGRQLQRLPRCPLGRDNIENPGSRRARENRPSGQPGRLQGSGGCENLSGHRIESRQSSGKPAHGHPRLPRGGNNHRRRDGRPDRLAQGPQREYRRDDRRETLRRLSFEGSRHSGLLSPVS